MKNFKLLLATTAILSMGAMAVNADPASLTSNQAYLDIQAEFVNPITATPVSPLKFSMILADEGGKTVIVTPEGTLSNSSTATVLKNSVSAGKIEFTGGGELIGFRYDDEGTNYLDPDTYLSLVTDSSVNLTFESTKVSCGTVGSFEKDLAIENGKLVAKIGGTLTTANVSSVNEICTGQITVTILGK